MRTVLSCIVIANVFATVCLAQPADRAQPPSAGVSAAQASGLGSQDSVEPRNFVPGRILVKFKDSATDVDKERIIHGAGARVSNEIPQIGVKILELPPNASETAQARAFGQQGEVEFAELDHLTPPASITPNDPQFSTAWHLPKISCPDAWSMTTGSNSVTIAIIDTGVDGTHPDLASKMVPGWNVYDNNSDTSDVVGHGTSTAGVAAAIGNNGMGVASPAWGCKIMPIRVIGAAGGWWTSSVVAAGITYAADHGVRIANVDSTVTGLATVDSAAQYLQSKGGVLVVPSGDSGITGVGGTDDPNMLTVSATDQNDLVPSWSNTGNYVDLSAPGLSIPTTLPGGIYGLASGTCESAPLVSATAALMLSVNSSLTPQQIQDILRQSADKVGPYAYGENGQTGWNHYYGYGRLNAYRAVQMAGGSPPTTGACCVGGSTCNTGYTQANCTSAGGVWQGAGTTTCTGCTAPPPTGACCIGGATCYTGYTQANCTSAAGTWQGAGTTTCSNCPPADTTLPTTGITSPTGGATVSATWTVTANASDNVGVTKVDLYVDGSLYATDTTSAYSFFWNTASYTNGSHNLQTKAYDAAGNMGPSTLVSVTVSNVAIDSTPPTSSITAPTGGTVSGGVTVNASASDNVAVTSVSLYVDGVLLGSDNLSPYSFYWNTASYANGTHSLVARASDAAGNIGSSTTVSVTVNNTAADTTAPTVTITSPPNGASVTRTLSVSVSTSDNVGVRRVELWVDGVIKSTATAAPWTTTWKTSVRGAHTLQTRAYDAAGNMGTSQTITVYK